MGYIIVISGTQPSCSRPRVNTKRLYISSCARVSGAQSIRTRVIECKFGWGMCSRRHKNLNFGRLGPTYTQNGIYGPFFRENVSKNITYFVFCRSVHFWISAWKISEIPESNGFVECKLNEFGRFVYHCQPIIDADYARMSNIIVSI